MDSIFVLHDRRQFSTICSNFLLVRRYNWYYQEELLLLSMAPSASSTPTTASDSEETEVVPAELVPSTSTTTNISQASWSYILIRLLFRYVRPHFHLQPVMEEITKLTVCCFIQICSASFLFKCRRGGSSFHTERWCSLVSRFPVSIRAERY